MELKSNQQNPQIRQGRSMHDPKERERLLMQYAGIFKNSIKEYGEKFVKKHKKQVNYSR